jgi:hypothetical protein
MQEFEEERALLLQGEEEEAVSDDDDVKTADVADVAGDEENAGAKALMVQQLDMLEAHRLQLEMQVLLR